MKRIFLSLAGFAMLLCPTGRSYSIYGTCNTRTSLASAGRGGDVLRHNSEKWQHLRAE